jgi:mannose-6-phosphate isomerase-like protein (cupin superfamily)
MAQRRPCIEKVHLDYVREVAIRLPGHSKDLFEICAEMTVAEERVNREILGIEISKRDRRDGKKLEKSPPSSEAVGTAASKLRTDLDDYYNQSCAGEEGFRFFVEPETFKVTYEQRRSFPPVDEHFNERKIPGPRFTALMRALCEAGPLEPSELNERACEWAQTNRIQTRLKPKSAFDDLMAWIESQSPLGLSTLRELASRMDIHPLLLDPLVASDAEENEHCLILDLKNFIRIEPVDPSHGKNAHYAVQPKRLSGASGSLVYLNLDPKREPDSFPGHSDSHSHPGEELMMPLEGSVEVRLDESGMRVLLEPGQVIHFYAEQKHSAWNVQPDTRALVLVVRSYPTNDSASGVPPSRPRMRKEVHRALIDGTTLSSSAKAWVLQTMTDRASRDVHGDVPDEIRDQPGLARLLRRLGLPTGMDERTFLGKVWPLAEPAERSALTPPETMEEFLWNLESRSVKFSRPAIEKLAELYKNRLYKSILLRYMFPAAAGAIVFRPHDDADSAGSQNIPRSLPALPQGYSIPTRNLAVSDIDIVNITLRPATGTLINFHLGWEVIVPLDGSATIEMDPEGSAKSYEVSIKNDTIAYFRSDVPHRVSNSSDVDCRLLALRFLA